MGSGLCFNIKLFTCTTMQLTEEQKQEFIRRMKSLTNATVNSIVEAVQDVLTMHVEPEMWRPKTGERFWCVESNGDIYSFPEYATAGCKKLQDATINNFNAFQTREQAEAVAKWQRAQRRLYMIALALNAGGRPKHERWFIQFNIHENQWIATHSPYTDIGAIYFLTCDLALQAIKMMGDDINDLLLQQ